MAIVSAGEVFVLADGQTGAGSIVLSGGLMEVLAGGYAYSDGIYGGTAYVGSGGITSADLISGGGSEYVDTDGMASGSLILNGGSEYVNSGGFAPGAIVSSNGYLEVDPGGIASSAQIKSGGFEYVGSGSIASGTVVSSGGVIGLYLSSGASVASLATQNGITLLQGALVAPEVGSGASTSGFIVGNGNYEAIDPGGVTNGTVVLFGGNEIDTGLAVGTVVSSGGELDLYQFDAASPAAIASGTVIRSGGHEYVFAAGVEVGATVESGGGLIVSAGGAATAAIVSGVIQISSGAFAYDTVVDGSIELDGGSVSGTVINRGGIGSFNSGTASGTVINNSGTGSFFSGMASGTVINSGGIGSFYSGMASGTVINPGGDASAYFVQLSDTTVSSGGILSMIPFHSMVSGGVVRSGGSISGLALSSGSVDWVPGVANVISGMTIEAGATVDLTLGAGTTISNFFVGGGGQSGTLTISFGAAAWNTVVDYGRLAMYGGSATGIVVDSGGTVSLDAGSANNVTVNSGGVVGAYGGALSNVIVSSGGTLYVDSFYPTVSGGAVKSGGVISGLLVSSGAIQWSQTGTNLVDGIAIEAGAVVKELFIGSSASISAFAVTASTSLTVSSGGIAAGSTIASGGYLKVYEGGLASGTVVSAGGTLFEQGFASSIVVSSGGQALIYLGSTLSEAVVHSGGLVNVSYGGQIAGTTTIDGGRVTLTQGIAATGSFVFSGSGGVLDLGDTQMPTAAIGGFGFGDTIHLAAVSYSSSGKATLNSGNVLQVVENGTAYILHLDPSQNFSGYSFNTFQDGGTDISLNGPPKISAPASAVLTGSGVINGVSIAETGNTTSESFTVSVSDAQGLLSASGANVSGSGTTHLTISGALKDVNNALATLTDKESAGAVDTVTITVADSLGGSAAPRTIAISVDPRWFGQSAKNRSGDFNTAKNWGSGFVPNSSSPVTVSVAGTYTITSAQTNSVGSLVVTNASATLDIVAGTFAVLGSVPGKNYGVIAIEDGAALKLAGALANNGTISLNAAANTSDLVVSSSLTLSGTGTVALGDLAGNAIISDGAPATLINNSTIRGAGTLGDSNLTLTNGAFGVIDAGGSAAGLVLWHAGSFKNQGLVEATGAGGLAINGPLANTGTLSATGGALDVLGAVTGLGKETIADGSTLTFASTVAATQTVSFVAGSTGTLGLALAQKFAGTVAGLAQGDAIDLENFAFAKTSITGVAGTGAVNTKTVITLQANALTAKIALLNQYANEFAANASAYELVSDHQGTKPGTLLELAPPHPS